MNRKRVSMKKRFSMLIILSIPALVLSACGGATPFTAAPTETAVPVVLEEGALNVEGRIVPKTYAPLAFQASGEIETIAV